MLTKKEFKKLKKATKKYLKNEYKDFLKFMKDRPFRRRVQVALKIIFKKEE